MLPSLQICSNWKGFFDPESGISSYEIGVGTEAGLTDIAELKKLQHQSHLYCVLLDENSTLIHDNVYYTVVWANNGAVNQRNVSGTSNGGKVIYFILVKLMLSISRLCWMFSQ